MPVRVVSMPSWELFEQQDDDYQESVLPVDLPTVSVEAGIAHGLGALRRRRRLDRPLRRLGAGRARCSRSSASRRRTSPSTCASCSTTELRGAKFGRPRLLEVWAARAERFTMDGTMAVAQRMTVAEYPASSSRSTTSSLRSQRAPSSRWRPARTRVPRARGSRARPARWRRRRRAGGRTPRAAPRTTRPRSRV